MSSLPFPLTATIKARPNTVLVENVPVAIWPARGRLRDAGMHYDHLGEAPIDFWADLREANRVLALGAEEYVIVNAERHDYLPHVAMLLRYTRSTGT